MANTTFRLLPSLSLLTAFSLNGLTLLLALATGETCYADLVRIARSNQTVQGNAGSSNPSINATGSLVAFESNADNWVAADTNGVTDIFVKNLNTDKVVRISTDASGTQANGASFGPALSANGRYVVFSSAATNLVIGDNNDAVDVFRKDLQTGATIRVSTDSRGIQADGASDSATISANGRFVAFASDAGHLVADDTNAARDVFVKDLKTGKLACVSCNADGLLGNRHSLSPSINSSGRLVAFASLADNLVTGDSNSASDIFVKNVATGALFRVTTNALGEEADGYSLAPAISGNGRYLVFYSTANNLIANGGNFRSDIYIKDLKTGALANLSTNAQGELADAFSFNPAISANGRYVAFYSYASNLAAGDSNSSADIFVKNLKSGAVTRLFDGSLSERVADKFTKPAVNGNGRFVAFESEVSTLVANDTNHAGDVFRFDARNAPTKGNTR